MPPCASAIARTIASPSPAPPRVRASSPRAKRSNARPASAGGSPAPSSATDELDRGAVAAPAERDRARAVAQRVVDEVAERLREPQLVGVEDQPRLGVHAQRPPVLGRAGGEARADALEQLGGVERLGAHGERAVAAARQHQQVLGELGEPVALVDGGGQRLAQVRDRPARAAAPPPARP